MFDRVQGDSLETLSDVALVRLVRDGNEDALGVLLERHSDQLYRFCCSLVARREDAEDICQEALTRAITRIDSLQSGASFRSWLFAVARNLAVDSFRERKPLSPLPEAETRPSPANRDTPQEVVEQREERRDVVSALGRLRRRHQRVLVLREVDRLSYADIAEALKVTESAVETLLFRARRRLREEFDRADRARALVPAAGGLRALASRLSAPLAGGSAPAAKLALTAAVVAGGVAAVPAVVPPAVRSAHQVPASPVSGASTNAHVGATLAAGTMAHHAWGVAFRSPSPPVARLPARTHRRARSHAGGRPEHAPIAAVARAHRLPAAGVRTGSVSGAAAGTNQITSTRPNETSTLVQTAGVAAPMRATQATIRPSLGHEAARMGRSNVKHSARARGRLSPAPEFGAMHPGDVRPTSPSPHIQSQSTRHTAAVLHLRPAMRTGSVSPPASKRVSRRPAQLPPPGNGGAGHPAQNRKSPPAQVPPTPIVAAPTPTALPAATAVGAPQPPSHAGQSRGNGPGAGGPPGQNAAPASPMPATTSVVAPATPGTDEGAAGARSRGHP